MPAKPRQPIADKVLKRIQKEIKNNVVDLGAVRAGRKQAQDIQEAVNSQLDLSDLPAGFAAYAWVQGQLSILCEQLLGLKPLYRFHDIFDRAEEIYAPSGPPMSPLTQTYYNGWMMFDVGVGHSRESLGSIALAVYRRFGAHENFLTLATNMVESRGGIYLVEKAYGAGLIDVVELGSGQRLKARNCSGYDGKAGEIWYVRLLPPNEMEPGVYVGFNTPYIMHQTSVQAWEDYFERVKVKFNEESIEQGFYLHMKYGDEPFYWPEYVFYSYINFTENYIYSKGLPDVPQSLPHHDEYRATEVW